jgi:hypothetical protein
MVAQVLAVAEAEAEAEALAQLVVLQPITMVQMVEMELLFL